MKEEDVKKNTQRKFQEGSTFHIFHVSGSNDRDTRMILS